MSNPASLKPFKKNDPRINRTGLNKGKKWLTTLIEDFLRSKASDGETYDKKFTKAGVLRAIARSDVLWDKIMDRVDGKVVTPTDITSGGEKIIPWANYAIRGNNSANKDKGIPKED